MGDGAQSQDRTAHRAAADGGNEVRLPLIQNDITQGLRRGRVIAAGEGDLAALRGNRPCANAVGEIDGAVVGDREGAVVDADRARAGDPALVGERQGCSRDECAAAVGIVVAEGEGGVAGLVEEEVGARNLAAPLGGAGGHGDEGSGRTGGDGAAGPHEGVRARRADPPHHLRGAVEIEGGSRADGQNLAFRGTALNALPKGVGHAGGQRHRATEDGEMVGSGIEVLFGVEVEVPAESLGDVLDPVGEGAVHIERAACINEERAFRGAEDAAGGGGGNDRADSGDGAGRTEAHDRTSVSDGAGAAAGDEEVAGGQGELVAARGREGDVRAGTGDLEGVHGPQV